MTLSSNLPHLQDSKFKEKVNYESQYLKIGNKTTDQKKNKGFSDVDEVEKPVAFIDPEMTGLGHEPAEPIIGNLHSQREN